MLLFILLRNPRELLHELYSMIFSRQLVTQNTTFYAFRLN